MADDNNNAISDKAVADAVVAKLLSDMAWGPSEATKEKPGGEAAPPPPKRAKGGKPPPSAEQPRPKAPTRPAEAKPKAPTRPAEKGRRKPSAFGPAAKEARSEEAPPPSPVEEAPATAEQAAPEPEAAEPVPEEAPAEQAAESEPAPEEAPAEQAAEGEAAPQPEPEPEPELDLPWPARARMIPKPKNDFLGVEKRAIERRSEDRFRIDKTDDGVLAVVSDGAGSSGLYCGMWAEYIVKHLSDTPIETAEGLDDWMGGFWKEFSDKAKKIAEKHPVKRSKLVKEGSCATMTACWLKQDAGGKVRLDWCAYGDSPMYVFEWEKGFPYLVHCHPLSLALFDMPPHLLNWKDVPRKDQFHHGSMDIGSRMTVVLASDGIGQFVLMKYLAALNHHGVEGLPDIPARKFLAEYRAMLVDGNSKMADLARKHADVAGECLAPEFNALRDSLATVDTFTEAVKEWYSVDLMVNDDSTLIMIDLGI